MELAQEIRLKAPRCFGAVGLGAAGLGAAGLGAAGLGRRASGGGCVLFDCHWELNEALNSEICLKWLLQLLLERLRDHQRITSCWSRNLSSRKYEGFCCVLRAIT